MAVQVPLVFAFRPVVDSGGFTVQYFQLFASVSFVCGCGGFVDLRVGLDLVDSHHRHHGSWPAADHALEEHARITH